MTTFKPIMIDLRVDRKRASTRIRGAIVLALVVSLAAIAIVSKKEVTLYLWVLATASFAPILIALLLRKEIASLPAWVYITTVLFVLLAAVVFGL